ncbi:MAG: energy coupling factor transporter S component ThiW [Promethearchaeota archaeon]
MNEKDTFNLENDSEASRLQSKNLVKKVTVAAILTAVGVILSYLNPFAYFTLFGTKINPFAHVINAISGVLIGITFGVITALGIAIIRFSVGIGTIHAFHGGISGVIVVGIFALILRKIKPKYTILASLFEPIGTVFIGGTIGFLIAPIGSSIEGLFIYWGLFAASCIPGAFIGFLMLLILKAAGITWEDFF